MTETLVFVLAGFLVGGFRIPFICLSAMRQFPEDRAFAVGLWGYLMLLITLAVLLAVL